MVNIKNLKKGDWISFSEITLDDNGSFEIRKENNKLCALFITDKKCLYGVSKKYLDNPYKYWFDVNEEELINVRFIDRDELVLKYKSHDIEIHKYKRKEDKSWNDYGRSRKDYNWKYDIINGINESWAISKRDLLDNYLKDLKDVRDKKDKVSIKFMEQAVEILLDEMRQDIQCGSSFILRGSVFSGISIPKTEIYFDVMLKNYSNLCLTHRRRVDTDLYYILLDFEKVIMYAKMYLLTQVDIELVTLVMEGVSDMNYILSYINSTFDFKKPLEATDIKARLDIFIPKVILKAEKEMSANNG